MATDVDLQVERIAELLWSFERDSPRAPTWLNLTTEQRQVYRERARAVWGSFVGGMVLPWALRRNETATSEIPRGATAVHIRIGDSEDEHTAGWVHDASDVPKLLCEVALRLERGESL